MFVVSKKTQNNAVKSYSSIVCIVLVVEKNSKYNRDLWFHNIVRHLSGDQQTSKHAEESYMHPADSFVYLHECLINGTRTSCARHLTAFFFQAIFSFCFLIFSFFYSFTPARTAARDTERFLSIFQSLLNASKHQQRHKLEPHSAFR